MATATVASFTAGYTRRVLSTDKVFAIESSLADGSPYVATEFMSIVMIDVSGYSRLTSELSQQGKVASETLTKEMGAYMCQLIDVVYLYHGDIVKFLGDAVLVAFCATSDPESPVAIIRRAVTCCLHILQRYPKVQINAIQASKPADVIQNANVRRDTITSLGGVVVRELGLHVAVTAGFASHVILGVLDDRLDYCIHGACFERLGEVLDSAKAGELGVSLEALSILFEEHPQLKSLEGSKRSNEGITLHEKALRRWFRELCPSWKDDISESTVGKDGVTDCLIFESFADMYNLSAPPTLAETPDIVRKFVNQAVLHKIIKDDVGALRQISVSKRSRAGSVATEDKSRSSSVAAQEPPNRDGTVTTVITDNAGFNRGLKSEFRTISVIFVKLKYPFSPLSAQMATVELQGALKQFGGIFNQFSVDDKGQSLFACFGLPPLTHENDAKQAVDACRMFHERLSKLKSGPFRVAVTTGPILFSKLGNAQRSEASFLGDVVNVASRLLSVDLSVDGDLILCDDETRSRIPTDDGFEDCGEHALKGKIAPVRVWRIKSLADHAMPTLSSRKLTFGYTEEKRRLADAIFAWRVHQEPCIAVIEAVSGMGKSKLVEYVQDIAASEGIHSCEMDQWTPFFAVQNIISFIFTAWSTFNEAGTLASGSRKASARALTIRESRILFSSEGKSKSTLQTTGDGYALTVFLKAHGEKPEIAPIIASLIPGVLVSENDFTRNMDGQTRMSLLSSASIRIINAWAKKERTIFIIDDAQWIDNASMSVFYTLAKSCPAVCLTFFTRPIADIKLEIMSKIVGMDETTHIPLLGVSKQDISSMLVHSFSDMGAKSASKDILNAIFEKSGGSPLHADMMIHSLKLKASRELIVAQDGNLALANPNLRVEDFLVDSVSASVIVQYDRLEPEFQEILLKASVLGQYFTLSDVSALFLGEEKHVPEVEIAAIITRCDTFQFLRTSNADSTSLSNSYYFRHITILSTVSEMLSYEDRRRLHMTAAKYHESLIHDDNVAFVLPIISYHYSRSEDVEKALEYLERLSIFYVDKWQYAESLRTATELLSTFDEAQDALKRHMTTERFDAVFDRRRIAVWHGVLAVTNSFLRNLKDALTHSKISLSLLKLSIPASDDKIARALIRNAVHQFRLFKETKGGTRRIRRLDPVLDHPLRTSALKYTMLALFMAVAFDRNLPDNQAPLILLIYTNVMIRIAVDRPLDWAHVCLRMAAILQCSVPFVSEVYLKKALVVAKSVGDAVKVDFWLHAVIKMVKGRIRESLQLFKTMLNYVMDIGIQIQIAIVTSDIEFGNFLIGNLNDARSDALQIDFEATNDPLGVAALIISSFRNALTMGKREEEMRPFFERVCEAQRQIEAIGCFKKDIHHPQSLASFTMSLTFPRDVEESIGYMEATLDIVKDIQIFTVGPNAAILDLCLYSFYLAEGIDELAPPPPIRSGQVQPDAPSRARYGLPLPPHLRPRLVAAVTTLRDRSKFLWGKAGIDLHRWTLALSQALLHILSGDRGRGCSVLRKARAALRVRGRSPSVEDMALVDAFMAGVLGIYSPNEAERRDLAAWARARMEGFGALAFARWLDRHGHRR